MNWIVFALLTPFLFSFTNLIEKFLVDKKIKDPYTLSMISGAIYVLISFLLILFRGVHVIPVAQMIPLIASGFFLIMYVVPYFFALARDDASRVVPLFQITPIFVFILSFIFLKERLHAVQILGFCIILFGGLLLGLKESGTKLFRLRESFWFMMLSSGLYAIANICAKYGSVDIGVVDMIVYQSFGIFAATVMLSYVFRKNIAKNIRKISLFSGCLITLNSILNTLAIFSLSYAFILGSASLVSIVENGVQPIILLVEGTLITLWYPSFIKEDLRVNTVMIKAVSILIILCGVGLVYI